MFLKCPYVSSTLHSVTFLKTASLAGNIWIRSTVRFQVFTAIVSNLMVLFWVPMPCGIYLFRWFCGTCFFHLQCDWSWFKWKMEVLRSSDTLKPPSKTCCIKRKDHQIIINYWMQELCLCLKSSLWLSVLSEYLKYVSGHISVCLHVGLYGCCWRHQVHADCDVEHPLALHIPRMGTWAVVC